MILWKIAEPIYHHFLSIIFIFGAKGNYGNFLCSLNYKKMSGNLFLFLSSILGSLPVNISSILEIFSEQLL